MSRFHVRLGALLLALAGFLWGGCGERHEYIVTRMDVQRVGWDTLRTEVEFVRRTVIGGDVAAQPDTLTLHVFSAGYDTLSTGPALALPVPDAVLGNQERVLVEVCGRFGAAQVCEQQALTASPKRVQLVDPVITYPLSNNVLRGRYDVRFTVERALYGEEEAWELIDDAGEVEAYLMAYVGDTEADAVRVPLPRRRGQFDLRSLDHYRDFKYYLDSELMDKQAALVHFDIYAGRAGQAERLASLEKQVELKTDEQRMVEIGTFVEQASAQVLAQLGLEGEETPTYAFLNEWRYNDLHDIYEAEVEIHWRGVRGFGQAPWHEIVGVLSVREDGSDAHFIRRSGNRTANRYWADRFTENTLRLRRLQPGR